MRDVPGLPKWTLHLGLRLKRLRKWKGVSQKKMAHLCEMTQPRISEFERAVHRPQERHLNVMAKKVFNMTTEQLTNELYGINEVPGLTDLVTKIKQISSKDFAKVSYFLDELLQKENDA